LASFALGGSLAMIDRRFPSAWSVDDPDKKLGRDTCRANLAACPFWTPYQRVEHFARLSRVGGVGAPRREEVEHIGQIDIDENPTIPWLISAKLSHSRISVIVKLNFRMSIVLTRRTPNQLDAIANGKKSGLSLAG